MTIRPVEAELFHTDGQTDMTKLIVSFRNFARAPKKDGRRFQHLSVHHTMLYGVILQCESSNFTSELVF
jgi:hypothetical protein